MGRCGRRAGTSGSRRLNGGLDNAADSLAQLTAKGMCGGGGRGEQRSTHRLQTASIRTASPLSPLTCTVMRAPNRQARLPSGLCTMMVKSLPVALISCAAAGLGGGATEVGRGPDCHPSPSPRAAPSCAYRLASASHQHPAQPNRQQTCPLQPPRLTRCMACHSLITAPGMTRRHHCRSEACTSLDRMHRRPWATSAIVQGACAPGCQ